MTPHEQIYSTEEDAEVPRTKIERMISLRLIHTYGVEDPAGLRRPELGASGVERREEQHFKVWWRLDLREKREGQPYGTILSHLGAAPPPLFIVGREGAPSWGGGRPLVHPHLGFSLPRAGHKGEEASS